MELSDWNVNFMNMYRVVSEKDARTVELVSASVGFPADDPVLQDMLEVLLTTSLKKRPDTGETCACKIWAFQETPSGKEDRALLTEALDASSPKVFQTATRRIAGRYSTLPDAKPGLVLLANVRVTPKKGVGGTFVVIFILDFEDLRRYDQKTEHLQPVEDAVMRRCRKALIFPHFDGREMNRGQLKLVQDGANDSLSELLYLEPPRTTRQLLEAELREAVTARPDGQKYESYFVKEPPEERELFGEERYINLTDLLPEDEVKHLSQQTFTASMDKRGKEAKVRIVVDEGVKFEGRLDKLGVNYFFARKGGLKYLIIRGEHFTTKSQLSSVEFLDVEELDQVVPRLKKTE